jgi:hypothetical protein
MQERNAMKGVFTCVLGGLAVVLLPSPGEAEKAKVFKILTNEHLEKLLKAAEIDFKKVPAKEEGITFFDYERHNYKVRLHSYAGKDLWLEAIFPGAPLTTLNRWNQRTKFTRAVLVKEDEGDSTSLEVQLDCTGGVTDGMVGQFFRRFDNEVQAFARFIKQ